MDDVHQLYPRVSEVRKLDELLAKRWNVDFFESVYPYFDRFQHLGSGIQRYRRLCDKHERNVSAGRPTNETELFKLLANEDLFAAVGSRRRHYILDGCAMAAGTLRHFGLSGAVLDAGCHIGITIDVLAHLFSNKFVGIDPAGPAIVTAKRKSADLPNVSYGRAVLPWKGEDLFRACAFVRRATTHSARGACNCDRFDELKLSDRRIFNHGGCKLRRRSLDERDELNISQKSIGFRLVRYARGLWRHSARLGREKCSIIP